MNNILTIYIHLLLGVMFVQFFWTIITFFLNRSLLKPFTSYNFVKKVEGYKLSRICLTTVLFSVSGCKTNSTLLYMLNYLEDELKILLNETVRSNKCIIFLHGL